MFTKGGITGLPENDFDKRQKSGSWTIDEHFRDVNYIRTRSYTPNNYLAVGNYEADELTVYDIFNNKISSLTKPLSGGELPSVACITSNKHANHLAIGMNKPPYLRVFDASLDDMADLDISEVYLEGSTLIHQPIFVKRFRDSDLVNNVFSAIHNFNDPHPATALISIGPNVSYPYEIKIVSSNQVDFIFLEEPTDISGIVYVHSSKHSKIYYLDDLPVTTLDSRYKSYLLDVSDDNLTNPVFQLYDSSQLIFPTKIEEIEINRIYSFDFPYDFDPVNTVILAIQGPLNYSTSFEVTTNTSSVIPPQPPTENVFVQEVKMGLFDNNIMHINHNFDSLTTATLIVDDYKNIMNSDSLEIINSNQTDALFPRLSGGISGMSCVYSHENNKSYSLTFSSSGTDYSTYVLDISSNNHTNPIFQVFDNNILIYPSDIREVTPNKVYHFDFPNDFVPTNLQVLVIQGDATYTTTFEVSPFINPVAKKIYRNLDDNVLHFVHNLDDSFPAIITLSNDRKFIIPETVEIINDNQVDLTFIKKVYGVDGFVCIYTFERNKTYQLSDLYSEPSIILGNTTYNLYLTSGEYINPIFQIFDSTNKMIYPVEITEKIQHQHYTFDFPTTFDPSNITILLIQGDTRYSETFKCSRTETVTTINHNLESLYLFVQVTDLSSGHVIHPKSLTLLDANTVTIDTSSLFRFISYRIDIINTRPDPDQSVISINHNLGSNYVFPQVVDTVTNQYVTPGRIQLTDLNTITIDTYMMDLSKTYKLYLQRTQFDGELVPTVVSPTVLINHDLDSKYLFFQIFDTVTHQTVYPDNINIQDFDNVVIRTIDLVKNRNYKVNIIATQSPMNIPEVRITGLPSSPVFCLSYDTFGEKLIVGVLRREGTTNSHLIEYRNSNGYVREVNLPSLTNLPTNINIDPDDKYLLIGCYSSSTSEPNQILYDYPSKTIMNSCAFNNLKPLTSDAITSSCFIPTQKLLVIGSHYSPFLYFYDYQKDVDMTFKYTSLISRYVLSCIVSLTKTIDDRYLLIATDNSPYLTVLDFIDNKMIALLSDYIVSSITSISLSVNDTYLCVTQREEPHIVVFEFKPTGITPIDINYIPETTPLCSTFFFGPVI